MSTINELLSGPNHVGDQATAAVGVEPQNVAPLVQHAKGGDNKGSGNKGGGDPGRSVEKLYRRFSRMLGAAGSTPSAVITAMRAMFVDDSLIKRVVGGEVELPPLSYDPQQEEEASKIIARFSKLVSFGIPAEEVALAMRAKAFDERLISAVMRSAISPEANGDKKSGAAKVQQRFKSMLKAGVPAPAIAQAMSVNGISDELIRSVVGDDCPLPPKPHHTAESEVTTKLAERFQRMIKVGIAPAAVAQAMAVHGFDETLIKFVLESCPPPPPEPEAPLPKEGKCGGGKGKWGGNNGGNAVTRFSRMLKAGIPADVLEKVMVDKGLDRETILAVLGGGSVGPLVPLPVSPVLGLSGNNTSGAASASITVINPDAASSADTNAAIISAVPSKGPSFALEPTKAAVKHARALQRYSRMLKSGVPSAAVAHSMLIEGMDGPSLASVVGQEVANETLATWARPQLPKSASQQLDSDAELSKHIARLSKMLAAGVPPGAIRQLAETLALDDAIVEALILDASSHASPPPRNNKQHYHPHPFPSWNRGRGGYHTQRSPTRAGVGGVGQRETILESSMVIELDLEDFS